MSLKRLAISFCAVVMLVFVAAVLQVIIWLLPAQSPEPEAEQPAPELVAGPVAKEQPQENARLSRLLARSGAVIADGAPLSRELAADIAGNATDFNANVGYLEQYDNLASGCEVIALCVALQAEGYDASPDEVAREHLRMGGDVATDYVGEPWVDGGGYPPVIVDAANSWLASCGADTHAHDLTGSMFEGVLEVVACGYPAVVWSTEEMSEPRFMGDPDDEDSWYFPEHCVVVYGTDRDQVLVSDSLAGLVRRDLADFASIYDACGRRALFVAKM